MYEISEINNHVQFWRKSSNTQAIQYDREAFSVGKEVNRSSAAGLIFTVKAGVQTSANELVGDRRAAIGYWETVRVALYLANTDTYIIQSARTQYTPCLVIGVMDKYIVQQHKL